MLGMNHVASRMRTLLVLALSASIKEASAFGAMTRGTVGGRAVEAMFLKPLALEAYDGSIRASNFVRPRLVVRATSIVCPTLSAI